MKILNTVLVCIFSLHLSNSFASDIDTTLQVVEEPAETMNPLDPYESFNRSIYDFNMGFHDLVGDPVTSAYLDYVPSPAQTGIKNFFNNLSTPLDALNSLLQGKVEDGLSNFMRFTINSTFGLGGVLDIATPAGLPEKPEDFGQTLYVWGVWDEATFVMVPFLGPYTTRGLFGKLTDNAVDPVYTALDTNLKKTPIFIGDAFVTYAEASPLVEEVRSQPDPYVFMRESYLQYRTNLIYDGQPPQADLDDFDFE